MFCLDTLQKIYILPSTHAPIHSSFCIITYQTMFKSFYRGAQCPCVVDGSAFTHPMNAQCPTANSSFMTEQNDILLLEISLQ